MPTILYLLRGQMSSPVNHLGGRCPHIPFFTGADVRGGKCPAHSKCALLKDTTRFDPSGARTPKLTIDEVCYNVHGNTMHCINLKKRQKHHDGINNVNVKPLLPDSI